MSNCIGSNIFDVLFCLGLPWLLDITTVQQGEPVVIYDNLSYVSLCLLTSAFIVIIAVYLNRWRLDRKLGVVFILLYIVFTTIDSIYDARVAAPPC